MSEATDPDDVQIHLTVTARSKCYRLLPSNELNRLAQRALRGQEDRIKQRLDPSTGEEIGEYHIRTGKYSVVVKPDTTPDGDPLLVVVTQMHAHADYANRDAWQDVDEVVM